MIRISIFILSLLFLSSCSSPDPAPKTGIEKDPLSAPDATPQHPAPEKKVDLALLYGTWVEMDSVYEGVFSDVNPLLKDSIRWRQKHQNDIQMGHCDGGCIFAWKFKPDGTVHHRMDDTGTSYDYLLDSTRNMITLYRKPKHDPADTLWKIEITYLDVKYMLEVYHTGSPHTTKNHTHFLKRTRREL
ncbi:MAG TPA: hypothetical protein VNZ86_03190 [Bacteroidia bacterium]|nr:hypothetical protein [Bacteroidia bacterium]